MREVNSLNNTRWECKYPIVFIPKYRKKAIFGQIVDSPIYFPFCQVKVKIYRRHFQVKPNN